jgi:hypothetical protein
VRDVSGAGSIKPFEGGLGGCGGRGLTADANLVAMGIESFFVCTLLILLDLEQSAESEKRS